MAKIILSFKKSFLKKEGLTKEGMERCLAILGFELRKAFSPGTIRVWKGKKFIKGADKKWRPYFEKKTHVTNMVGESPKKTEAKDYYNEAIKTALGGGGTKQEKLQRLVHERNNQLRENNRLVFDNSEKAKEHSKAADLLTEYINKVKRGEVEIDSALEKKETKTKTQTKTTKKKTTKRKTQTKKEDATKKTEEKKTETKVEPKEEKEEKKESKKSIDIDFESLFPDIFSGRVYRVNDTAVSLGKIFTGIVTRADPHIDIYGFKKIICQYLRKRNLSVSTGLKSDNVAECEAVLELATESLLGEPIKDNGKRRWYEKDGVIAIAEKSLLDDRYHLKRVDITSNKADEAIKERAEHIKNTPSRQKITRNLQTIMDQTMHIYESKKGTFNSVFDAMKRRGVECLEPKRLKEPLSEEEIVKKLSFFDGLEKGNSGYCASLALLYIAAKNGFDVLDKKGEKSRYCIASNNLCLLDGALDMDLISDSSGKTYADSTINLLNTIKEEDYGKQYYLTAGGHAAIVRKVIGRNGKPKLQFLELQGANWDYGIDMGWVDFVDGRIYKTMKGCLNERFGCQNANRDSPSRTVYMFDIDDMKEKLKDEKYCSDFTHLLGYLNTKK